MAAQKEIPIEDSELDALMDELDRETSGMVVTPTVTAAAAPVAEELTEDDLGDLDDATAVPEPEPVATEDDELAALQAELDAQEAVRAPQTELDQKIATVEKVVKSSPDCPTDEVVAAGKAKVLEAEPEPNPTPPKKQPQLQFYLDVDAFKTEIAVSENNLDNCMMQQAGLFAWHAAEGARAEAQHARVKLRFDVVEAKLYDRHRKAIAATGEKTTEKAIENAVRQDPEWLQAKNMVIEAEMLASINKGAVESLRHRKDMIVQMGADRREEYKGQTRTVASADPSDIRARAIAAGKLIAAAA